MMDKNKHPVGASQKLTLVVDKRTIRLDAINAEFIIQRFEMFNLAVSELCRISIIQMEY
jgi:hypothetical protein